MRVLVLLPLAIGLAGCTAADEKRRAEQARIDLPAKPTLPFDMNEDCECVENDRCEVAELQPGYLEAQNVSCKWTDTVNEATCEYEVRFVAERLGRDGKSEFVPGPWDKKSMIARHLGGSRWCRAS